MSDLLVLAPAKVNLGLFVGPTRADGRHELVTVMQPITLADRLQARVGHGADVVRLAGAEVDGEELAARALKGLRERGVDGPPLEVVVEKRIPVAAGLAGGSADAGAALRLAAALWPAVAKEALEAVAAALGADVPAQLSPRRYLARGVGELLTPLPEPRERCAVLVAACPFSLSTAAVYREADRLGIGRSAAELADLSERLTAALADGAALPAGLLENDLERAALSLAPELAARRRALEACGPDSVLLSGSGPTLLGFFVGEGCEERADAAGAELADRRLFAQLEVAGFAPAAFAAPKPLQAAAWHNGGDRDE